MKHSASPSVEKAMEAHDILGIPTDASEERVRAAYKALVRMVLFFFASSMTDFLRNIRP
jgi:preprotein translocase subunit Sec63